MAEADDSQVTALGNGTRIALRSGYAGGQQTYTAPIRIAGQPFRLQLDTGSADLWVASSACRDAPCQAPALLRLNDADFRPADADVAITYLDGAAAGPIVTASVAFAATTIPSQALAAADAVQDEDLATGTFSGVLGLSLPANSIQQLVLTHAAGTDNPGNDQHDPSLTGSVLPGLWSDAPSGSRFFAVGLQRRPEQGGLGDSVLTWAVHDASYAPDPNKIVYQAVIPDADQVARHWRTSITEIVVSVGGNTTNAIRLQPSAVANVSSNGFPLAILDTGAPISLGPPDILNSMYGAFGINPAQDGGYYMPCSMQLNISLTINGAVIPIHPLDASLYASVDNGDNCIGAFQAPNHVSPGANVPADFVIAAPLMRSMYSVFSCEGITNPPPGRAGPCKPRIGLLPTVTNLTKAHDDFYKVRVLKQALGSSAGADGGSDGLGGGGGGGTLFDDETSGISSGLKILIGCLSGLGLIVLTFLGLLFLMKRRRRREERRDKAAPAAAAAALAAMSSGKHGGKDGAGGGAWGGRRSTGFASRRHPSDVSASAFASSRRSQSKVHLGDDEEDDHFGGAGGGGGDGHGYGFRGIPLDGVTTAGGVGRRAAGGGAGATNTTTTTTAAKRDRDRDRDRDTDTDSDSAAAAAAEASRLALDPKYRALAQMHGVFLDEVDDDEAGGVHGSAGGLRGPRVGPLPGEDEDDDEDPAHLGVGRGRGLGRGRGGRGPGQDFDLLSADSAGTYQEARAIRNDYLRRHPSLRAMRAAAAGGGGGSDAAAAGGAGGGPEYAQRGIGEGEDGGIPLAELRPSSGAQLPPPPPQQQQQPLQQHQHQPAESLRLRPLGYQ